MKKTFFATLFSLCAAIGWTQPVSAVVAPFEVHKGVENEDAELIAKTFYEKLVAQNGVRIAAKSAVTQQILSRKFNDSDWKNTGRAVQLAKSLNAAWLLIGAVSPADKKLNGSYTIDILPVSTYTGKDASHAKIVIKSMEELNDMIDELVIAVVNSMRQGIPNMVSVYNDAYNIGDTGPGGGIIFYDKGTYTNGWRYLEIGPVDAEMSADWGAFSEGIMGLSSGIGAGKKNTQLICEYLKGTGETGKAAQLCAELKFGGHNDWFLPSKEEMSIAFVNLKQKKIGEFRNGWYWTSTSARNNYAWYHDFESGRQVAGLKNRLISFRPARSF